jgi:hypothetical protein
MSAVESRVSDRQFRSWQFEIERGGRPMRPTAPIRRGDWVFNWNAQNKTLLLQNSVFKVTFKLL